MKIRVYYEDTDCGGVVYHSNYLNFCERARSELFFEKGLSPHMNEREFFVVKQIEADFVKPAKLGDLLEIKSEVISKKNASLLMCQEVFRENEKIFKLNVKLVYLKDFRPTKIPEDICTILIRN